MQVVPLQAAPLLLVVSQRTPQPVQLVAVVIAVSHPSVSGAVLLQSSNPLLQLV